MRYSCTDFGQLGKDCQRKSAEWVSRRDAYAAHRTHELIAVHHLPSAEQARALARILIERRLAACVQFEP